MELEVKAVLGWRGKEGVQTESETAHAQEAFLWAGHQRAGPGPSWVPGQVGCRLGCSEQIMWGHTWEGFLERPLSSSPGCRGRSDQSRWVWGFIEAQLSGSMGKVSEPRAPGP